MHILSLPLQILSLPFYPPLDLWRLTFTDGIIQIPLSSGFQRVWPIEGISGGGGREGGGSKKEGKRSPRINFSSSLSASSHLAVILFLFLVPHLLLGCSFLKASAFTRLCSSSYFRPKESNSFPCYTIPCWFPSPSLHLQLFQDPGWYECCNRAISSPFRYF